LARTVGTFDGPRRYTLLVRRCETPTYWLYHRSYRPDEEGAVALPHGEFGLDVIALIGALRYVQHRSVPEIHADLRARGLEIAERTVTNLLDRPEAAHYRLLSFPIWFPLRVQQRGSRRMAPSPIPYSLLVQNRMERFSDGT